MKATGRWADLLPRFLSGFVLAVVAGVEVWLGGLAFEIFIAAICAAMIWELARMQAPDAAPSSALGLAGLAAVCVFVADISSADLALGLLFLPALAGAALLPAGRVLFAGYAIWIALASYGFHVIRADLGMMWMAWLISVVMATDIAGYFAGKGLGGPKFWRRVSPKKTWSGTVAGWLAAAVVGAAFMGVLGQASGLIVMSVLSAMAAQAGDIAESILKRRAGVKDSSNLIPGHGGFLDRFDGMIGAALFVLLAGVVTGIAAGGL